MLLLKTTQFEFYVIRKQINDDDGGGGNNQNHSTYNKKTARIDYMAHII